MDEVDESGNNVPTEDDDDDDDDDDDEKGIEEEDEEEEDEDDEEQQGDAIVSVAKNSVAVTHLALAFLNFPLGSRAR